MKSFINPSISCNVLESLISPSEFNLPLAALTIIFEFSPTFAPIVFKIKSNDSNALSPEAAAMIKAVGLLEKTTVETVHSSAFFNAPGKLKTYSGAEIIIPSASSISWRRYFTATGGSTVSKSELKCGNSAIFV